MAACYLWVCWHVSQKARAGVGVTTVKHRCGLSLLPPVGAPVSDGRKGFCSGFVTNMCHCPRLSSTASFAPISFAIKAKENDLLPLEKNRVKLDDDSDEDGEHKEGQESACTAASADPVAAPPCVGVEEKRPPLTQEELEAKQGLCAAGL